MISDGEALLALQKVAEREGKSLAEVRAEIQRAIDEAYGKPAYREAWSNVPFSGERPTPEDVIAYIVRRLRAGN